MEEIMKLRRVDRDSNESIVQIFEKDYKPTVTFSEAASDIAKLGFVIYDTRSMTIELLS